MGAGDVSAWVGVFKDLGDAWPIGAAIAMMLWAATKNAKSPSESGPASRADYERLEERVRKVEISLSHIEGALGIK